MPASSTLSREWIGVNLKTGLIDKPTPRLTQLYVESRIAFLRSANVEFILDLPTICVWKGGATGNLYAYIHKSLLDVPQ